MGLVGWVARRCDEASARDLSARRRADRLLPATDLRELHVLPAAVHRRRRIRTLRGTEVYMGTTTPGCSGAGTRWSAVPANISELERRSGKISLATGGTLTLKRSGESRRTR